MESRKGEASGAGWVTGVLSKDAQKMEDFRYCVSVETSERILLGGLIYEAKQQVLAWETISRHRCEQMSGPL